MAVAPAAEDTAKYKLKFLGMKWRFLRFDLERETFPPLKPGEDTRKKLERQNDLEQSVVLETFEKGLNLSQSVSLSMPNESSFMNQSSVMMGTDSMIMAPESTVSVSMGQGCAMSSIDSEFTEEDIMMGIRNMQMFRMQEPIRTVPPSAARSSAPPTKSLAFSPRPPDASKPSSYGGNVGKSPRSSPRGVRPGRRRKGPTQPTLKEQVLSLDIGRDFKLYAIENGVRIPECVKAVQVNKGESSPAPSRSRHSSLVGPPTDIGGNPQPTHRNSSVAASPRVARSRSSSVERVSKSTSDEDSGEEVRGAESVPPSNL